MSAPKAKIYKQGYLVKQGGSTSISGWKTWKKRWFVFSRAGICYYDNEKSYQASERERGFLDVNDNLEFRDGPGLQFGFHGDIRHLACKAASKQIKQEWATAVAVALEDLSTEKGHAIEKFAVSEVDGLLTANNEMEATPWAEGGDGGGDIMSSGNALGNALVGATRDSASQPYDNPHLISPTSIFEGYLSKLGRLTKSWKRRYFVLYENKLVYYKHPKEKKPNGEANLTEKSIVKVSHLKCTFVVQSKPSSRSFVITAKDSDEMLLWLRKFEEAVEGLVVQRQLAEGDLVKLKLMKQKSVAPGQLLLADAKTRSNSIKEGYMSKLSKSKTNWKRRYFVLTNNRIDYYKNANDKKPKDKIALSADVTCGPVDIPFSFAIITKARKYMMTCVDDRDREGWLTALRSAVDGKMKVVFPERKKVELKDAESMLRFIVQSTGKTAKGVQDDFLDFCTKAFCDENARALLQLEAFKRTCSESDVVDGSSAQFKLAKAIFDEYFTSTSPYQVCVSAPILNDIKACLRPMGAAAAKGITSTSATASSRFFLPPSISAPPLPPSSASKASPAGRSATTLPGRFRANDGATPPPLFVPGPPQLPDLPAPISPPPPTNALPPSMPPPLPDRNVSLRTLLRDSTLMPPPPMPPSQPEDVKAEPADVPDQQLPACPSSAPPPMPEMPPAPQAPAHALPDTLAPLPPSPSSSSSSSSSSPASGQPVPPQKPSRSSKLNAKSRLSVASRASITGDNLSEKPPPRPAAATAARQLPPASPASPAPGSQMPPPPPAADQMPPPPAPGNQMPPAPPAPGAASDHAEAAAGGGDDVGMYECSLKMFDEAQKMLFASLRDDLMPKYLVHVPESQVASMGLAVLEEQSRNATECATVDSLLNMLTDHKARFVGDALDFRRAFFLNYPTFITAEELFNKIQEGYNAASHNLAAQVTSRIHLVSLVNEWASSYIEADFDETLLEKLDKALDAYAEDAKQHLLESRSKERSSLSYRPVTNLCLKLVATTEQLGVVMFKIKSKLASGENNRSVEYSMVDSSLFSSSKALSIDPQRIALYFIILDSYFYRKIKPREFCNKAWTRKATAHMRAPAILKLVDIWNSRSFWVATQILMQESNKFISKTLEYFIHLADICLERRNFFSLFAIVMGLSLAPVYRLKTAWSAVSATSKNRFNYLKTHVTDSKRNFSTYRNMFKQGLGSPQIPHIAMTLKDCFLLEEIDTFTEDKKVNFSKFAKQYGQLRDVLQAKQTPYHITIEELGMAKIVFRQNVADEDQDPAMAEELNSRYGIVTNLKNSNHMKIFMSHLDTVRASVSSEIRLDRLLVEDDMWKKSYHFESKKTK